MGSFIIGLDIDERGVGKRIAEVARKYGVDNLNVLFLTPLPGTRQAVQQLVAAPSAAVQPGRQSLTQEQLPSGLPGIRGLQALLGQ